MTRRLASCSAASRGDDRFAVPRELELHMALAKARLRAMQAEIDQIFEKVKKDPEV